MNFISKFLADRFVTQKEHRLIVCSIDDRISRVYSKTGENINAINDFKQRIENLEERLKPKPVEPIAMLVPMSTTDAIIKCLIEQDGKKLYIKRIYDMIKNYDLINPNVALQSVKATLYQLARQKRIVLDNGTEAGMFFIEKK